VQPELTLFMLVTNRDCVIANYAVHSYRKLWDLYNSFVLEIYANCLTPENKRRYFPKWKRLSYVSIRDNESERQVVRRKGAHFSTPEGLQLRFAESCEHYDEVWTREHQLAKTPFWATVDADFEVLEPHFLPRMMDMVRGDTSIAGVSTDYSPTNDNYFDTYSNAIIRLNERWHTWCCIYRQETGRYLRDVSSFYFERILPDEKRDAFDSYANVQQHLLQSGYRMAVLPSEFQRQFIHYGAFSKNRSITRGNVHLYRRLAIAAQRGLVSPAVSYRLNAFTSRASRRVFNSLFSKAVAERHVFDFDD